MNSGRQDFTTPCRQDFRTSVSTEVSTDVNQSVTFWKGESSGPFHFDRFCSRSRLRERVVRLFRLAGEQVGTGRDIRPVFGGQKHYMFCPRQAVFSVTRNRFRNRKQLARKGVENSSEVVAFYRAPRVPRPISWRPSDPRHFHSKLAPQSSVFAHYRTQKRGKSRWIYPVKKA